MDKTTGVAKSFTRMEDENGRQVLRVVVDFYDGAGPPLNNGTIWHQRPVTIIECDPPAPAPERQG